MRDEYVDWHFQMRHIADNCSHSGTMFEVDGVSWCDDTWCGPCYAREVLGEKRPPDAPEVASSHA